MGYQLAIVLTVGFAAIGLSIWGLFNKRRSIWCAVAGAVLILAASLGALHAWGEGRSIPWTTAYSIMVLIGTASLFRQMIPRRQADTAERPPAGDSPKAAPEE